MNTNAPKWLLPVAAIALFLVLVAWMAGSFDTRTEPGTQIAERIPQGQAVVVERVEQPIYEPVPATVEARQATLVSSRILARIVKVHVRAGDLVKEGQLLVELEQTDLKSRVAQAKSNVQSVTARLTEAEQGLARSITLKGRGLLAQADLDKAQANRDSLRATLANAEQALDEAEASLAYASVRAPIEGRIVDRFAEPGDTVQPGMKLVSLYNPSALRVEANVREALALSLKIGQALQVEIPSVKTTVSAEIDELVPAGNPGSRSFQVKCRFDQMTGLLPGMYARLLVPVGTESKLLIPSDAVATVGQLQFVNVDTERGVQRRYVRLGKVYSDTLVEVVSGLDEGEKVLSETVQP